MKILIYSEEMTEYNQIVFFCCMLLSEGGLKMLLWVRITEALNSANCKYFTNNFAVDCEWWQFMPEFEKKIENLRIMLHQWTNL